MNFPSRPRRCAPAVLAVLAFFLLWAGQASATMLQESEPGPNYANLYGDDDLVIEEGFQSHLPATLRKYSFRLSVHPHLGDWQNKDRMRVTTGLRYGLTDHCEINASSDLYFSHGHGDVPAFEEYGAANLRFGVKFDLGQILLKGWETGAGVDYELPIGEPPAEVTDGLRHLRSYVTFSHRLEAHPMVRVFVGFRLDAVTKTSLPGEFGKNAFRQSAAGITGGWVLDRGNLHYTFEASYDSTRWLSRTEEDIYSIRPGVMWEIPSRHDPQLLSPWLIGVSLNDTYGPGGNSVGASFKLRYSRDLKYRFHSRPVAGTR